MGIERSTLCEFRLVRGATRASDRIIAKAELPAVPAVGESVDIDGWSLIVRERSWSLSAQDGDGGRDLCCCLRVIEVHEEGA